MLTLTESGMEFGPFNGSDVYHVEKCITYMSLNEPVKIAEFLLYRPGKRSDKILAIEAKTSAPNPTNKGDYDSYVFDISEKLKNAFSLMWAVRFGRHGDYPTTFPEKFRQLNYSVAEFRFVVVVRNHQLDWLAPLQDSLKQTLAPFCRVWGIKGAPIAVLNGDGAIHQKLVSRLV